MQWKVRLVVLQAYQADLLKDLDQGDDLSTEAPSKHLSLAVSKLIQSFLVLLREQVHGERNRRDATGLCSPMDIQ